MTGKKVNFQSIKVKFPQKAYILSVWIMNEKGEKIFFPMPQVYEDPENALKYARQLQAKKHKESINMIDWCMLTPIIFMEKIPLKKEYWEDPNVKLTMFDRIKAFGKPFVDHKKYKLLVTPLSAKENTFSAPSPFKKTISKKELIDFMKSSEWYVDPEADSVALYSIEESIGVNFLTGETYDPDRLDEEVGMN